VRLKLLILLAGVTLLVANAWGASFDFDFTACPTLPSVGCVNGTSKDLGSPTATYPTVFPLFSPIT